jgi:hypothetical protein
MVLDTGSSRLAALEKNSPLLLPSTPNRVSALEKENKAVEEVETVQRSSKWGRGEEGGEWELWGESVIGFMCGWALVDGLLHFLAFNLQKQENGLLHLGFWALVDDLDEWSAAFSCHFLAPIKDFHIVVIHPDHNSFILVQHWNQKLVSYNMDTQELHGLCTLENGYVVITPYIPCFLESSVLATKH